MAAKKDITKIVKDIQKTLRDVGRKRTLRPIAAETIRVITKRTRDGRGVKRDGGNRIKLKKLAPSTVNRRKRLRHLLSPLTRPGKSNLTFSGEMIFSIGIKSGKPGTIVIGPKGRRNTFLASLHDQGTARMPARPFMHLAKVEQKQLAKFYRKSFLDLLKKKKLT